MLALWRTTTTNMHHLRAANFGVRLSHYKPVYRLPKNFGHISNKPQQVRIGKRAIKSRVKNLPPPRHDYIMFKQMSGNEILLNLENSRELRDSELISGLLELGKRDKKNEHDWMVHQWVRDAIADLTSRVGGLTSRHLIQVPIALNRLRYEDTALYNALSQNILKVLHKYTSRELVKILRIFSPPLMKESIDDFEEQFRQN